MPATTFHSHLSGLALWATCAILLRASPLAACTLCGIPPETLSELVSKADHAVIARLISIEPGSGEQPSGKLLLSVTRILASHPERTPNNPLSVGSTIQLPWNSEPPTNTLFLLTGSVVEGETEITWGYYQDMTADAIRYLEHMPGKTGSPLERLQYFLTYLEHADSSSSNDAWGELAGAPFEQLVKLEDVLPVDPLRHWLRDPGTLETRLGLYGLLLGIAGRSEDLPLLESLAFSPSERFNIGRPAILGGYLILGKEHAHHLVHEKIILNAEATFDQRFAALEVFRFLWIDQPDAVPAELLQKSMHVLLNDSQFAALVIVDLARWQDWSAMEQIVALMDQPDFSDDATRLPIIRYLQAAANPRPAADPSREPPSQGNPPHVAAAIRHLDRIRQVHPELFRTAGRFQPD